MKYQKYVSVNRAECISKVLIRAFQDLVRSEIMTFGRSKFENLVPFHQSTSLNPLQTMCELEFLNNFLRIEG